MLKFSHATDLPTIVIGYVVVLLVFVVLLRRAKEIEWQDVPAIAARLAAVFALVYGLCWLLEVTVCVPALILILGFGVGVFVLSVPSLVMMGAVCEFVLGVQLHNEAGVLTPPETVDRTQENVEFEGARGVTLSPLKPSGEVFIDGKRLAAISDGRKFVDADQAVIVVAVKNGTLVVSPEA